jgi:hypothetical protein
VLWLETRTRLTGARQPLHALRTILARLAGALPQPTHGHGQCQQAVNPYNRGIPADIVIHAGIPGLLLESSFRQMKDPHAVSFSPMFHWTEHNIRVHTLTCVLALQIAHLMRLQARRAGLRMSVRELLAQLAGIGETILIYPTERGRPKARRMLTETTSTQDNLTQIFQLDRYAPKVRS